MEQLADAQGYVEDDVFFFDAVGTEGSGVVATVAGVDDDTVDLEAEGADERGLAVGSLLCGFGWRGDVRFGAGGAGRQPAAESAFTENRGPVDEQPRLANLLDAGVIAVS